VSAMRKRVDAGLVTAGGKSAFWGIIWSGCECAASYYFNKKESFSLALRKFRNVVQKAELQRDDFPSPTPFST